MEGTCTNAFFQNAMNWKILLRSARKYIILTVCTFLLFSFSFFDVSQSLSYCRWINMVVLESSEYAPFRISRFTLFTKIISTRVTWGFNVFLENKIISRQWSIKMFCTRITNSRVPLNFKKTTYWSTTSAVKKGDVTWDDSKRRFLAQHSVDMLEQCCNYSKQCRNDVATPRFAKNRRCESSRVTSP